MYADILPLGMERWNSRNGGEPIKEASTDRARARVDRVLQNPSGAACLNLRAAADKERVARKCDASGSSRGGIIGLGKIVLLLN
jgi:hypothetical protein